MFRKPPLSLKNVSFETEEFTQNRQLTDTSSTTTTDSDTFETVNTNSSTEVETVEIEEVIIEENQHDPLAQTIFVGETNGVYINSVDVYFFQTDETSTVTFQIREVELGTPTQKVLAYSETIIPGKDIVTSEDGRVPHTFTMKSPVYLAGGKEYCLVLMSQSTNFIVWISSSW